jgi:hypothetical protein
MVTWSTLVRTGASQSGMPTMSRRWDRTVPTAQASVITPAAPFTDRSELAPPLSAAPGEQLSRMRAALSPVSDAHDSAGTPRLCERCSHR